LYFSELPIIKYDFSKVKTIYNSFLKIILKIEKRFLFKKGADVSMTSADSAYGPLMDRKRH
jgi:hypothetical protein